MAISAVKVLHSVHHGPQMQRWIEQGDRRDVVQRQTTNGRRLTSVGPGLLLHVRRSVTHLQA
jgi:hypothetical protein